MRTVLATTGFLMVAAFFVTAEHRAHLFGLLPYLLLLACPLLHFLGHSGDGSGHRPSGTLVERDPHEGHGTTRKGRS